MLGAPRRVAAGALHYFDSLQRALTDRLDRDALALANRRTEERLLSSPGAIHRLPTNSMPIRRLPIKETRIAQVRAD